MRKVVAIFSLCVISTGLFAQEQKTPEQMEKEFRENLDRQIETMAESLGLSDAQIFWVDSILSTNMYGMRDEIKAMNKAGVGNPDLYMVTRDKWMEKTREAFSRILNLDQWSKYLKSEAGKEKKARDKRARKRNQGNAI